MNDFLCPKCREHLRVGENIIFKVKNSKKQAALLLLNPHIGNYTSHKNLARVIMVDGTGESHNVYFSRIVGEHSTFETDGESVHIAGEEAGKYTYFKIGEKFRKYF
jgi:hypothetical protein